MLKFYNLTGCFLWSFIILFLLLFFKLWLFILFFLITLPIINVIIQILQNIFIKKTQEFEPKLGQTYKYCQYCNTKCSFDSEFCPKCKSKL